MGVPLLRYPVPLAYDISNLPNEGWYPAANRSIIVQVLLDCSFAANGPIKECSRTIHDRWIEGHGADQCAGKQATRHGPACRCWEIAQYTFPSQQDRWEMCELDGETCYIRFWESLDGMEELVPLLV